MTRAELFLRMVPLVGLATCTFDPVVQGHPTSTSTSTSTGASSGLTSTGSTAAPTSSTSSSASGDSTTLVTSSGLVTTNDTAGSTTSTITSSSSGSPTTGCLEGVFGPEHTFLSITAEIFVTVGCCTPSCEPMSCSCPNGPPDVDFDAAFFCQAFYGPHCTVMPGYQPGETNAPKMHRGPQGCTTYGEPIPGTECNEGQPCWIGDWPETTKGIVDLVCECTC